MRDENLKNSVDYHSLSENDYIRFREFLQKACGIVLGDQKKYLVLSRMKKLLDEYQLNNISELIIALEGNRRAGLRDHVIDAMTTNETSWFRDKKPFEALSEKILPEYEHSQVDPLTIWSAACASGQESYSIAITMYEYLQTVRWSKIKSVNILGTDISSSMLRYASKGVYSAQLLDRGMSESRKRSHFDSQSGGWAIKEKIRSMVKFREANLLLSYGMLGKFDIIFCRNVLIYFSDEVKKDILNRMAAALKPGGYLILGSTESMASSIDVFDMIRLGGCLIYKSKSERSTMDNIFARR